MTEIRGFESVGEKFQEHRHKKKVMERIKNNAAPEEEEEVEESRYSLRFSTDVVPVNESDALICPTCHQAVK